MGWWETKSSRWQMAVVAQMGGAAGLGAGVFFLQFKSADIPTKPVFVAVAGGVGVGGSVSSAVSIPYSAVVRQFINPKATIDTSGFGFSDLDGSFSCKEMNGERFQLLQAGGSVIVVGAQVAYASCTEVNLLSDNRALFSSKITIPKNLPQVGAALLDVPQVQGGFGLGAFAFRGPMFYIGTS